MIIMNNVVTYCETTGIGILPYLAAAYIPNLEGTFNM